VGNIPGDIGIDMGKKIIQKAGGGNAVRIKVSEYQDFFMVLDGGPDSVHGFVHIFESERVGQVIQIWIQKESGLINGCDLSVDH
jgi:hypothetical protein